MYWWTPYAIVGLAGFIAKVLWERRGKSSLRTRMRIATWSAPAEPNMYGMLKLDVTKTIEYLKKVNESGSKHPKQTLTHLIGKAVGIAMKVVPEANKRLVADVLIPREDINVSFLVHIPSNKGGSVKKTDLGVVKVTNINTKTLGEIADTLAGNANSLRNGSDQNYNKTKKSLKSLPMFFLRFMLSFGGWLSSGLGINIKSLGVLKEPFGGAMITSVARFGLEVAYAPFTPFANVPFILTIGKAKREPVVREDENGEETIVIRDILNLGATVDHRYIDGAQVGQMATIIRECVEDPESMSIKYGEYMK